MTPKMSGEIRSLSSLAEANDSMYKLEIKVENDASHLEVEQDKNIIVSHKVADSKNPEKPFKVNQGQISSSSTFAKKNVSTSTSQKTAPSKVLPSKKPTQPSPYTTPPSAPKNKDSSTIKR